MSELEARFRVSLIGKEELSDFLRNGQRDVQSFASNVRSAFGDAGKTIAAFGVSTAKSLASLATGNIGIAQQAKNILEFRDRLEDLAIQAGVSDDQLGGLRDQIHNVAKASNQMQNDVTDALGAFVARTGDIDTARRNLELYAKVATATGASLKDVALVGVELSDKLGIKDQGKAFGILTAQGRAGAVEIRDMATKAPRIFSSAASMFGVKGEEGLRGTGALAQVFARAFGGSGTAASVSTSIENVFNDIAKHQAGLEKAGIKVQGRDPYEVIKDIIVKANGDPRQLLRSGGHGLFDVRAMRGINVLAREYRDTGGFGTFDRFKNIDGADISADAARRMQTGDARLKASQISIAASADKNLGDAFDRLAHHADLISGAFDAVTKHPFLAAGGAGLALVAKNLITGMLKGGGGGGLGARLLGAGGVQHVWVDNPGFGGGGGEKLPPPPVPLLPVAGALGIPALLLGYTALHNKALDFFGDGDKRYTSKLQADLASGRKRAVSHWYGGTSYEDVSVSERAKYAAEYAAKNPGAHQASEVNNNISIVIKGDKADVTDGTRSTEVQLTRQAAGAL